MSTTALRHAVGPLFLLVAAATLHLVISDTAEAFSGFGQESCSDLVATPQRFRRHRDGTITYRISNNFIDRYPDLYSRFLVTDMVKWWEDYINAGYSWSDDIATRFSYFRDDPSLFVVDLKSVLNHEFGHAMGMQHSDACFYNINNGTGLPWESNHRVVGGGALEVQPTLGPELMNEGWVESSPGVKAPKGAEGYNRLPGRDDWEFLKHAYPFQSLSLDQIDAGSAVILFDSTDAASGGGQTSYPGGYTAIVPGDGDQGHYLDGVNVWIGNNMGYKQKVAWWGIENNTGSDITQITVQIAGSGTRRAIWDDAPEVFTNFSVGTTTSPEIMQYTWSTSAFDALWEDGSSDNFGINLDVHDWVPMQAYMWHYSNDAWPIPLPGIVAEVPWGVPTPQTPPPGYEAGYTVVSENPEPSIEPTDIEMLAGTGPQPTGVRALTLMLPDIQGLQVARIALLPLDWTQAEIILRDNSPRRRTLLERAFDNRRDDVIELIAPTADGYAPASIGARRHEAGFPYALTNPSVAPVGLLRARFSVPLADNVTYAALIRASTGKVSTTLLSLPEMTDYLGTRIARCGRADDASSCCPNGARVTQGGPASEWLTATGPSSCLLGKGGDDTISITGREPQIVAAGDGNDRVYAFAPDAIITLGRGDDTFAATKNAAAHVAAGQGADILDGSDKADTLDGGAGDDQIDAAQGDDLIIAGAGADKLSGGPGNDTLMPGSGADDANGGDGDDRVVILHLCELDAPKVLEGGRGDDTLVLPTSLDDARQRGLRAGGFEHVVEYATRDSRIADCEMGNAMHASAPHQGRSTD